MIKWIWGIYLGWNKQWPNHIDWESCTDRRGAEKHSREGGYGAGNATGGTVGGLKPGTLSNTEARQWYLELEAKIPDLIDDSL